MRSDRGLGLIELLVVLSLMTLALTVFGMAFGVVVNTSRASRAAGDVTDDARLALNELDRQVRFGYWVRPFTCGVDCEGVKVLTQDAQGERYCWTWALHGGLLKSFHVPASEWSGDPVAATPGWDVAAQGLTSDSSLAYIESSAVEPLNPVTLERAAYWTSVNADLWIDTSSAVLPFDPEAAHIWFQMTVRNPWIGAPFAAECPSA